MTSCFDCSITHIIHMFLPKDKVTLCICIYICVRICYNNNLSSVLGKAFCHLIHTQFVSQANSSGWSGRCQMAWDEAVELVYVWGIDIIIIIGSIIKNERRNWILNMRIVISKCPSRVLWPHNKKIKTLHCRKSNQLMQNNFVCYAKHLHIAAAGCRSP